MILCIGLAADATFMYTVSALRHAQRKVEVLDLALLAYAGEMELDYANPLHSIISLYGATYKLSDYSAALIRLLDISEEAPTTLLKNRVASLYLVLSKLFSYCQLPVINPTLRDNSNFSKLFHTVSLAHLTQWTIPRSCLTNSPDQAQKFIEECAGQLIFKGASGIKTWATRYDATLHKAQLSLLTECPVLFQECIEGYDVRIHAVGKDFFAEAIHSDEIDYRQVRGNRYHPIELPEAIQTGCAQLIEHMAIPFLGIDFKVEQKSGLWYFLEANTLPCYEGYDKRAGGIISQAIVAFLSNS